VYVNRKQAIHIEQPPKIYKNYHLEGLYLQSGKIDFRLFFGLTLNTLCMEIGEVLYLKAANFPYQKKPIWDR